MKVVIRFVNRDDGFCRFERTRVYTLAAGCSAFGDRTMSQQEPIGSKSIQLAVQQFLAHFEDT